MDLDIYPPLPQRKDVRIGILGSGFIVDACHLVSYRKAGFNPVAIASRNRQRAAEVAQRHQVPKVFDTYEQLLDDPAIEVLDIAVPPQATLDLIKAACRRRTVKGILAQKPLGINYNQAVEAVRVCEAAGITLAVNQNMRYDHSVRAAKTLLRNGTIGDPVIATVDMRGIPHWQSWQAELGWVTLRIMSIHHLDTFRYWFGEPERIFCSTRPDPRTKFPHTDGVCAYILEYAGGLRCIAIDDTWTGPAMEDCPEDIYIEWRVEGLNGLAIGNIGWCLDPYTTPSSIRYASKGHHGFQVPVWSESWFPDAFAGTMGELLLALENARQPSISGRDNLKTMALVEAAYLSAERRQAVNVEEIGQQERAPTSAPSKPGGALTFSFGKWKLPAFLRSNKKPAPADVFNNFTPRAQQALAFANQEAERLHHKFIGTEHVLLGIIKLEQGVALNVMRTLGLNFETIGMEIEKQVGVGPDQEIIGRIPYTPRVKKVLRLAAVEAKSLNHTYVGTEHLLLGLLREGDGVAARVLNGLGVKIDQTRAEILKELDPNFNTDALGENIGTPEVQADQPQQPLSNFTPRAQQVLALARKEADRLNHHFVGVEHLLIGLIRLGQGVAVNILQKHGVTLEIARTEVESLTGRSAGPQTAGNLPYTPGVKAVFQSAAKEAKALNHAYIGTEHLLLGLLREGGGFAAQLLNGYGVNHDRTRAEILKELDPNSSAE
jgi:predicted dehydrogenase